MIIIVEFPLDIINSYNGASNLDITLDDNISYLIGKYFYENKIDFKIDKIEFVSLKHNKNDELVRYELQIAVDKSQFRYEWILNELKQNGFDKGSTIKDINGEIIYADDYMANKTSKKASKKSVVG